MNETEIRRYRAETLPTHQPMLLFSWYEEKGRESLGYNNIVVYKYYLWSERASSYGSEGEFVLLLRSSFSPLFWWEDSVVVEQLAGRAETSDECSVLWALHSGQTCLPVCVQDPVSLISLQSALFYFVSIPYFSLLSQTTHTDESLLSINYTKIL